MKIEKIEEVMHKKIHVEVDILISADDMFQQERTFGRIEVLADMLRYISNSARKQSRENES